MKKLLMILASVSCLAACGSNHHEAEHSAVEAALPSPPANNTSNVPPPPPAGSCIFNQQLSQYTNMAGQICVPLAAQITCPPNGIYTNNMGQQQACTPGQVVNTGGGYGYPGQYQYPGYQNQTSCDGYYYQYGIQHVPVVLGGQLQCMRIDLVNQASYGTPYYQNQDYYYAYPPDYYQNSSGFCLGFAGLNYCSYN